MKKSEIKNGMHVITNNGNEYIIISGIEAYKQIEDTNTANTVMIQLDGSGWMPFDDYDDDLCYHDPEGDEDDWDIDRYYDIKAVYTPQYYSWTLLSVYDKSFISDKFIKVWERPRKKMTKAEIEKELGYGIEIVDDERG